jgi:hypothetical protein
VIQVSIDIRNFVYFPVIWCEQLPGLSTVVSRLIASFTGLHVSSCEAHLISHVLDWECKPCLRRMLLPNSHATFLRSYPSFASSEGTMDYSMRAPRHRVSSRQQFENAISARRGRCLICWIPAPVRHGAARLVSLPGGYDRRVSAAHASAALCGRPTERMSPNPFVDGHWHSIGMHSTCSEIIDLLLCATFE